MILLAGINGAGKTTFYYTKIKPFLVSQSRDVPFVNADEIEKSMFPDEVGDHSYTAAREAARLRTHCFDAGLSFVTETVFSHQSKIDLIGEAQQKGFEVILNHVHVDDPEKAIKRVNTRTQVGGHAVPEKKVRERFPRTIENLKLAVTKADRAYVWDNNHKATMSDPMHRFVFSMHLGNINKLSSVVPKWAMTMYGEHISHFQGNRLAIIDAARTSLENNSSDPNKLQVVRLLNQAGIQQEVITHLFQEYGGVPTDYLKVIE